jgi:hypothetical protein
VLYVVPTADIAQFRNSQQKVEKWYWMDELKNEQMSIKEWVVTLPLIGAALAITYDVGFFYGIGISYFTLFSLSEHILFALQAIPIAFVAALMIPSGALSFRMGKEAVDKETPPIPPGTPDIETLRGIQEKVRAFHRKSQRGLMLFSILFIASGLVALIVKQYFFGATIMVLGLSGLAAYWLPPIVLRGYYFVLWYTAVFMVMSFFLGFQAARGTLEGTKPANTINTASMGELHGILIRSGERGVLFYEPGAKAVRFLVWGDIKSLQSAN